MAAALTRKAQHTLNSIMITQLNLLRGFENLGIQLVSYGQAFKNINESNSFRFEPIEFCDLGPKFAFEESIELLIVDVVKMLAAKST